MWTRTPTSRNRLLGSTNQREGAIIYRRFGIQISQLASASPAAVLRNRVQNSFAVFHVLSALVIESKQLPRKDFGSVFS